jgi:hypothetical protein
MLVPQRKHLWASTACYGDSFAFLYVDHVRTSQETHLWAPRSVTEIALPSYMYMMLVPHKKHLWASTACYGDSFTFLYVDHVRTSHETHKWASTLLLYITKLYLHWTIAVVRYRHVTLTLQYICVSPIFIYLILPACLSFYCGHVLVRAPGPY